MTSFQYEGYKPIVDPTAKEWLKFGGNLIGNEATSARTAVQIKSGRTKTIMNWSISRDIDGVLYVSSKRDIEGVIAKVDQEFEPSYKSRFRRLFAIASIWQISSMLALWRGR